MTANFIVPGDRVIDRHNLDTRTLVLDQSYRPCGVVDWTDAVTMIFTSKVDVLSEYEHVIHAPSGTQRPAVIRLKRAFHREVKPVKFSRVNVYARDGYACMYCGLKKPTDELTYDHVVPRSRGGKTVWTNIVTCCSICNANKKNRTPEEAGMRLLKKPVQPRAQPEVMLEFSNRSIPDAWRDFVYWTQELECDE